LDHKRKVEEIARRYPIATVVHLLCNDFSGGLYFHCATADIPNVPGVVQKIRGCDEIDLTLLELEFDEGTRLLSVVLRQIRGCVAQTRRDKTKVLRIRYEDVDVFAQPMAVTEHQHRSAA